MAGALRQHIFVCGRVLVSEEQGGLARKEGQAERFMRKHGRSGGQAALSERLDPNLCEGQALAFSCQEGAKFWPPYKQAPPLSLCRKLTLCNG